MILRLPACTATSAFPPPSRDCVGQPLTPRARRRAGLQLRSLWSSRVSPAGNCRIELRTGAGTPNSPPRYWIAKARAAFAPSRSGVSDGAIVAVVSAARAGAARATHAASATAHPAMTATVARVNVVGIVGACCARRSPRAPGYLLCGHGTVGSIVSVLPSAKLTVALVSKPPCGHLLGKTRPLTWNNRRLP